jgi:hypothetical protein
MEGEFREPLELRDLLRTFVRALQSFVSKFLWLDDENRLTDDEGTVNEEGED